jgi:hypothetical protein
LHSKTSLLKLLKEMFAASLQAHNEFTLW